MATDPSAPAPFAGNDYLGLARDPRLAEALYRGAKEFGISSTSSRWGLGWTEVHDALQRELADFFGFESACILGATYFGGLSFFEVIAKTHKVVYCDATCHINLFQGMRAAGMEIRTYRHNDAADLRRQLEAHRGPPPAVATDAISGISGELAPLAEVRDAAKSAKAELLIDDAHGVFAMGPNGRGAMEACGVGPQDATMMGSMSKALGCNGGFIAGRKELVRQFRRTGPAAGSALPPPPVAAAAREGLRIVRDEPQRRATMWANAKRMHAALDAQGIEVVCRVTPIVTMALKDEDKARRMDAHFLSHGLKIPYFKYASEPRENLLRAAARACYTEEELQRFEAAVANRPK